MQLSAKPFTDKDLYVAVQKHIEVRLNANAGLVHPYCLSLDTIGNAMFSLVTNKCITKQTVTGTKPIVQYITNHNELSDVFNHLRRYSSVFREFNGLSNYKINARL